MTTKRLTTIETEADLEARIRAAIKIAFPWLPDEAIKHQIKFSFQYGRSALEVDSFRARSEARLDILLEKDAKPLAVLELKRHNLVLSDDDDAQGLSYARLVQPPAPLVIVTNGTDVRILETHTGKPWTPLNASEKAFETLISQASLVAKSDIRFAIEHLMGTNPLVWMQAVRDMTTRTINELTATSANSPLPFAKDFLMPRNVTLQLYKQLEAGAKMVVLQGTPSSGKSNVLRELTLRTNGDNDIATLYIEAGTGCGPLQALADVLSEALGWPVSANEARDWLIRISQGETKRLVLAFDGVRPTDPQTVKEIEDLTSQVFGPLLSVVVAVDESTSEQLLTSPNRRAPSVLGRRSKVIHVGLLEDFEFDLAVRILAQHRIGFIQGARAAPEYRTPWVLRTIVELAMDDLRDRSPNHAISLAPLLGLREIAHVRQRFANEFDLRRLYLGLAKAQLNEAQDTSRAPELVLKLLEEGVIRRDTANKELEPGDLQWLVENGYVRVGMSDSGGATILIRLPELLASETARVLTEELVARARADANEASEWLADIANYLRFGEVIAAQAIYDATKRPGGVAIALVNSLLESRPERETLNPDGQYSVMLPGGPVLDISFDGSGKAFVVLDGKRHELDVDDEQRTAFTNMYPWLILSHVASRPFVIDGKSGPERMDPDLLLELGTCEVPLRSARGSSSMRMQPTLTFPGGISILDTSAGIVEPITLAILNYISREKENRANEWIARAVQSESLPLLFRIHIALHVVIDLNISAKGGWAKGILLEHLAPRIRELID